MFEAIVFDGEGVVLDTEESWDRSQEEFLRRRGVTYNRAELKHVLTGRSLAEGTRLLKDMYKLSEPVERLAEERFELFTKHLGTIHYMGGFLDFYGRVSNRYRTCVASSAPPELLETAKAVLGMGTLFGGHIFSLADVNFVAKPDPALFLYAARQLSVEPSKCVVIEDAPLGITAAKRAGMFAIALTTTYDEDQLREADMVANGFHDIKML